jgi:hypothetical protein
VVVRAAGLGQPTGGEQPGVRLDHDVGLVTVLAVVHRLVHVPGVGVDRRDHPIRSHPTSDPPPPVGAVGPLGRFDILPGDQRQQPQRLPGPVTELGVGQGADDRAGVVDQRRHQRRAGPLVVPRDRRLARIVIVVPGALARDDPRGAGHHPAHLADRGDQLRHGVLSGDRIIEHHRVQRPPRLPAQHPGLVNHRPDRVEDPVRPIRASQPTPPIRQRGRMEPLMIQRQPTRHLPPQITPHRLHRITIRQVVQRLQHQHRRRHVGRQARPPGRTREQILEQRRRKHLPAMLGQERENRTRRHQMTDQRGRVHQLTINPRRTLHHPILPTRPHNRPGQHASCSAVS